MKKFSLLAMSAVLAASMAVPASAAENWEKAYSDIIYKESLTINYNPYDYPYAMKYGLYDIDGNGTPELFLGTWQHSDIYTMKNGKAALLTNVSLQHFGLLPDENSFLMGNTSLSADGEKYVVKCQMKDGRITPDPSKVRVPSSKGFDGDGYAVAQPEKMEFYINYFDGVWTKQKPIFMVNGKRVDEKTYWQKFEQRYAPLTKLETHLVWEKGLRVNDLKSKITKRIVNKRATASSQKITVNGKNVTAESYLIDGNNYCKLRDIAYILKGTDSCFSVGWDSRDQMIVITTGQDYTGKGGKAASGKKTATSTAADIYIDGDYVQLDGYNIGGSNYFKLRDIAEFVNAEVTWNNATKSVNIRTKNAPQYDSIEDMMEGYDKFLRSYSGENVAVATTEYKSLNTAAYRKWMSNPPSKASIKQGKVSVEPEVFALRDITGDGMPELFVGGKYDQYTVYKGDCNSFLVYTWKNGKMMPLFGNSFMDNLNPSLYLADGKYLVTYGHGTSGYQSWEYVSAVNGEVKVQFYDRTERPDGSGEYEYFSNGSKITKKEFDMHDAYESKAFSFEKMRFVDNTSSNRAAYLK